MELSKNSLNLIEQLKLTFQGRPVSLAEFENLKYYTKDSFNELKEHEVIIVIVQDDYPIVWLTSKGVDMNVQELIEKKEQEQEKIKINKEIEELKKKISELTKEDDNNYEDFKQEYEEYIDLLHEYNEVKDAGQILMGRLAELEGTTTKSIYSEYQMDLED